MPEAEAQAAWNLLNGELKDQFLGWVSGESVGFVWDHAPAELRFHAVDGSRGQLLEAHRTFYTNALSRKWEPNFHTQQARCGTSCCRRSRLPALHLRMH